MHSSKKLEYIASGMAYLQLPAIRNHTDPEIIKIVDKIFQHIKDNTGHKLGVLFNAYTEPKFGARLACYNNFDSIHADSGGLQIITRGMEIDEKTKDQVYRTQAKSADMGMCFDEIPIGKIGNSSGRNDFKDRWFESEMLEDFARKTGANMRRQIEIYLDEKSKCKPILIAQGNCYDTYMKWVDYILDEIPNDHHKYIGGVAMGAAALGTGSLEDIDRAFIFSQVPVAAKHLHVLGIGAIKRLMPYLVFVQNGLYEGCTMSYDSTTHTSGVALGIYYTKEKGQVKFNRNFSKTYVEAWENMKEFVDLEGFDAHELHKCMNSAAVPYIEGGGRKEIFLKMVVGFIMSSIYNFIKHVDKVATDKTALLDVAEKAKFYSPAKFLFEVKSKADYDHWYRNFQSFVPSKRVMDTAPSTLEGFFE